MLSLLQVLQTVIVPHLTVDNVEKRGRKRQKVWDHFTKDDKGRAECKYCTKDVPARANESMKETSA